jgi:hypothetical protein
MNKSILNSAYFLVLVVLALAARQKVDSDKIPPIIFINGPNPQYQILGIDYCDKGFAFVDDKGVVDTTVTFSPPYNKDSAGKYQITYSAVDGDGNVSNAERILIVEPLTAADYIGDYFVSDTLKPLGDIMNYEVSVAVGNIDSTEFEIANFGNFGYTFKAPFTSDSIGNINLYYSSNDTIIDGTGTTFCDKTGFRIEYLIQLSNGFDEYHNTTFKIKRN